MSRARITRAFLVALLLPTMVSAKRLPIAASGDILAAAQTAKAPPSRDEAAPNIEHLFQRGQDALNHGRLDEAQRDFQNVLSIDPQSGGAYANLGVVYMRRRQWSKALEKLQQAARLMPQVAGIRLNLGLVYYRQNEFLQAIPEFESVVREQPEAVQPRYLLGLCYFFTERWADAAGGLEPLWEQESQNLPYLYVLSNAAHRAGRKELDDRATAQLLKLGANTPEYRLFVGKYYLNLGQYDQALAEFQAAATANPSLPFVHFNLGLTYRKKQEYDLAREEFLKDAAVEPDLALNYDALGEVYWLTEKDGEAEKSYREALRLDLRLVSSRLGLARIYQRQEKYTQALAEIEAAGKVDAGRPDVHYLRGRVLLAMGRKEEARKELAAAEKMQKAADQPVPAPELMRDTQ